MDIQSFLNKRSALSSCYSELISLAHTLNASSLSNQLAIMQRNLLQDGFKIIVVGEFSRGKSTFINALLGKRVLPSKTRPTTTIINRITYGADKKFILHYRDTEQTQSIDEDAFKKITAVDDVSDTVSEQKINEISRIAYAEIAYPIDLCRDGIELIDTPGTNDTDQLREEITFSFIPEADAAILLLSATQILSRSELDFLKERILKNDIAKVFFVINFKDQLEYAEDGKRIIDTALRELTPIVREPKIFLVSSKQALNWRRTAQGEDVKGDIPPSLEDTGFVELEAALSRYLLMEKSASKLEKYIKRGCHWGDELIAQTIRVREANLGCTVQEIEKNIRETRPKIQRLQNESHRIFSNLKTSLQFLADNFSRRYRQGLERIAREATMSVYSYQGDLRSELIARAIESTVAPLQTQNELEIQKELDEALTREFQNTMQKLRQLFKDENITGGGALTVVTDSVSTLPGTALTLEPASCHDDGLANLLGGGVGGLILISIHAPFIAIPAAIFGGKFFIQMFNDYRRSDFLAKVSGQVQQRYNAIIPEQTARFKSELERRVHDVAESVENTIDGKLENVEEQLNVLLRNKESASANDANERAYLKSMEQSITNLQQRMHSLLQ